MKMLPIIIAIGFLLIIEIYGFLGLRNLFAHISTVKFLSTYAITTIVTVVGIFLYISGFRNGVINQPLYVNVLFGLAFSLIVGKMVLSSAFLIEDILRGFTWLFQSVFKFRAVECIRRSVNWGILATSVSLLLVIGLNYGVWFGKYNFKVRKTVLEFEDLPEAFDGYTIAQLSDLHLGTFDSKKKVAKGLQFLQAQHPDVILFTGDMVNFHADEVLPYIDLFAKLEATDGKYTVMGNHDYADHGPSLDHTSQQALIEKLNKHETDMGLQWLNNDHVTIKRGGDSIVIAGVENWGLPPFPQHGMLSQALEGTSQNDFTILLSHDPTHWREQVVNYPKKVHLTLSGHTHGMQFGFEHGKFRWSPVKYRYADWAGLFTSNNRNMYVNRGFGSIGYPGRLGIWPEIAIIELRKK